MKLNELSEKIKECDEFTEESREMLAEMLDARSSLTAMVGEKIELFRQTAEGTASQERMFLFMRMASVDENGNQIFETNEDLENFSEENPEDFGKMLTSAYLYNQGMDEGKDFTEDWEEVSFIERANAKEQELFEKKKKEEEAKAAKKTTTRKRTRRSTKK